MHFSHSKFPANLETSAPPTRYSDVVIIGAGFSGINVACQLQRQLGVSDFTIYDRADEIGGAWAANKYPGCAVDIPGVLYSLSWFPNTNFTDIFPSQQEVLEYLGRVARTYDVPRHTQLRTDFVGAQWIEKSAVWRVHLRDLESGVLFVHEAKILVEALGGYCNPKTPSLAGIENFEGTLVHTATWDKSHDLRGKNVVVIGNGCSATQVVPAIVDDVKRLTQIIRSPQHYFPKPELRITNVWRRIISSTPFVLVLLRWFIFWLLESALIQFYDGTWGQWMRNQGIDKSKSYVKEKAPQRYQSLLTPNYELGCRRRILDRSYLQSLHDPKLLLVQDRIVSVGPKSVLTASGAEYPADFLICATGFQFTQWKGDNIIGRNGISAKQHWERAGGIGAYQTVALNGFPNHFFIMGPNSGSGHQSIIYTVECATNLVISLVKPVLQRRVTSVEVLEKAEIGWCKEVQGALRKTVLTRSCSNGYTDAKTRWNIFSNPYSSLRFWMRSKRPQMSHWRYN